MAKVRQNIVIHGLSGQLGGELVVRQDKAGRTIVSAKAPADPNRQFTDVQIAHQEQFREATGYAKATDGGKKPPQLALPDLSPKEHSASGSPSPNGKNTIWRGKAPFVPLHGTEGAKARALVDVKAVWVKFICPILH